ncbi:hypothetical protein BJF82_11550 [Kytococcus sp. CUA-901]|nr:hypothetical protein BJF82_11550 [Kytococcus sp. CUA-901]
MTLHTACPLRTTLPRTVTAGALLGTAILVGPVTAPEAHAAGKPGACAEGEGVTVIVQDPNNNVMRCAPGDPVNGEEALEGAGFTIVHNYSGLICQIGYDDIMYPQECPQVPMPYWSYWQAQHPGDSWYYSDWGAITYDPDIDDFEGWRFGVGHTTPNNGVVPLYAGQSGPQPEPAEPEKMPQGVVPSGDSGVTDGSWKGGDYSTGDPNHPGETFTPSPTTSAPASNSATRTPRPDPTGGQESSSAPAPAGDTATSDPAAPAGEPTRNENAAGPSSEAPGTGYGSLFLTGGLLAAVALGLGAWMRFGRR